jgi:dephospho-CoA kinase
MLRGLPNSFLIAIEAPAELRFERLKKRNDRPGDAEKTWEEFMRENDAEPERMIEEIAKEADVTIDNSGTMDALRREIQTFLREKLKLVP